MKNAVSDSLDGKDVKITASMNQASKTDIKNRRITSSSQHPSFQEGKARINQLGTKGDIGED